MRSAAVKYLCLLPLYFAASMPAQVVKCPSATGNIDIAASTYSPEPGVAFHLRHFSAALVPLGRTSPRCFTKLTEVSHGEVFVTAASLTRVFNTRLRDGESKIRHLRVVTSHDGVTLSGETTKLVPIHFSISGPVNTDGLSLRLKAEKFKADGIPLKALLELVGQHLSSVLSLKTVPGVTVDGDTMAFFPESLAHLQGHIESVTTTDLGLTIRYGAPASTSHFHAEAR